MTHTSITRNLLRAFSLLACAMYPMLADAGAISISPLRVELSQAQRSVVLTVSNNADKSAVVQTQLMAWSQADNEDRLAPTNDIIASPPIFTLAPGASQLVRVYLRRAPDAAREAAFRIILTEVPGTEEAGFNGARFSLKLSLPIFVEALKEAKPQVQWSGKHTNDGKLALSVANSGGKHIQVQRIAMGDAANPEVKFAGLLYVLAGQQRTVMLSPEKGRTIPADRARLTAETDAGALQSDVVLERP